MAFADTINEKMRLDFSNAVESVIESDMSVLKAYKFLQDKKNKPLIDALGIVLKNSFLLCTLYIVLNFVKL